MRYATLQDHLDCDKWSAVERAAALGLDGIELVVPDGTHDVGAHGMELDPKGTDVEADGIWSEAERARLRRHAEDHDVSLASLCPSYLNFRAGLTSADADDRVAAVAELRRLVDAADDLGAGVVLVPFFLDAEIRTPEERRRVADAIRPAAVGAEDSGVVLALETSLPAEENRALVEAIDSSRVRLYYDVGNAAWSGYDPAEEIRTLADVLAPRIHFKDGKRAVADSMLGEGRVDFTAVAEALADVGYDEWIVFETMYRDDPGVDLGENLRFARSLLE